MSDPQRNFPPFELRVVTTLVFLGLGVLYGVQGKPIEYEAVMGALTLASLARLDLLVRVSVAKLLDFDFSQEPIDAGISRDLPERGEARGSAPGEEESA
jgi:hypothetical protein